MSYELERERENFAYLEVFFDDDKNDSKPFSTLPN
jgi:hypothetical protein